MIFIEDLREIFWQSHTSDYIGEQGVSQLEHALLAAQAAENENKEDIEMITAAFCHDIGHQHVESGEVNMISPDGEVLGVQKHELVGAEYLRKNGFSDRVCVLVGNHVKAKRYLVSIDPEYENKLSVASRQTFALQGGKMTQDEIDMFQNETYFLDSLKIRKYDELAKDVSKITTSIEKLLDHYMKILSHCRRE